MASSERDSGQERAVTGIQEETTIQDISKEARNMGWAR